MSDFVASIDSRLSRQEAHLLALITSTAEYGQALVAIREHLRVLNGSVAKHEDRLRQVELHPMCCDVRQTVETLRTQVQSDGAARTAVAANNKTWMDRLWPVVKLAVTGVVYAIASMAIWAMFGKEAFIKAVLK